jgi:hypothetical protein
MRAIFPFCNTKGALSFLKKLLLRFISCDRRGREAGAFLVRKIKPPEDFTSDN